LVSWEVWDAARMTRDELSELVDSPNETLEVEYKSWLNLADDNEARADLARHIAALSNHGGGHIVFGFTDDLRFAGTNPHSKAIM
jgi:predicted HTH transcriptional regulator